MRAAILLIQNQGGDAKPNAIRQIAAMRAAGDAVAEMCWTRIFGAIADLEATESARRQAAGWAKGRGVHKLGQAPGKRAV